MMPLLLLPFQMSTMQMNSGAGGMQYGGTMSQAAAAGSSSSALGAAAAAGGTLMSEGGLGTPKNPLIMSFVSHPTI